ncbi:MAG: hypothetical protein AVDCRST_MAG64-3281 [uncultured Phycisphaerae bacterium]|uniref:Uncharacterized protein n=1 Tax=uncultured Phycisphaerae bacterium TaxID=904963 RepID=A0A6J4Q1U0_9BACT|nr:MAG: hypothetical protein AVDCRST_MAG64-3281 [uncultured Phycisphaerae bacterium]
MASTSFYSAHFPQRQSSSGADLSPAPEEPARVSGRRLR